MEIHIVKIKEEWVVLAWVDGVGMHQHSFSSESQAEAVAEKLKIILTKKIKRLKAS